MSKRILVCCLLLGCSIGARASAEPQDLEVLSFLAGCWRGSFGASGTIEEVYTDAAGGVMVGTTRFFRDGRVVQFEFAHIGVAEGQIVLLPYPGGRPSEHGFVLTHHEPERLVFEAPEHDYPKRIIYALDEQGQRVASIDGGEGDTRPTVWTMQAVACAGS